MILQRRETRLSNPSQSTFSQLFFFFLSCLNYAIIACRCEQGLHGAFKETLTSIITESVDLFNAGIWSEPKKV